MCAVLADGKTRGYDHDMAVMVARILASRALPRLRRDRLEGTAKKDTGQKAWLRARTYEELAGEYEAICEF